MKSRIELEAEMREKCPEMFAHSGLQPGEVWLGNQLIDVVFLNASIYRRSGAPSVRVGTEGIKDELKSIPGVQFEFRSVFVKLDELIAAIQKD